MSSTQAQQLNIARASSHEFKPAFELVCEYFEAINVVARDDEAAFKLYFEQGSGFWLARMGEQLVGCIAVRPLGSIDGACEVRRLYVKSDFRGQNIADKLLDELHDWALSSGYKWCYLDTKDDLKAAIRFYERRGYERCERYNENPQATIFMRKSLIS